MNNIDSVISKMETTAHIFLLRIHKMAQRKYTIAETADINLLFSKTRQLQFLQLS